MKKYIPLTLFGILVLSFLVANSVSAQGMMGQYNNPPAATGTAQVQDMSVAAVTQDIASSQKVSNPKQIDCSQVTDSQFEKLGDAYMGLGITEEQHTAMENMMGGEGSATLTQAHINMGRAYLGCWANYKGSPALNSLMMGGQYGGVKDQIYPSSGAPSRPTMMGGYYGNYGLFGVITMILLWAVLIFGIVAIVKWLKGKK